jgi:DNA helicase-2/ATP-dependent DNA helicase PcrA
VRYKIVGGVGFYDRREVKDVLAYLRVVHNPLDSVSLERIINTPTRGIGQTTINALKNHAAETNRPLWDVIQDVHDLSHLLPRARNAVGAFAALINEFRELKTKLTVTQLAEAVLGKSGYLAELESEQTLEAQNRVENVKELLTVTTRFEVEAADRSLGSFLEQSALVSDLDALEAGADVVTMMTLHSAKGLEFPIVFLVGMEEGIFPHQRSLDTDTQLEEERRLCYVGITRAKEQVYLSHAYRRTLFGGISNNPPSRFLREIPGHLFQGYSVSSFTPDPEYDPSHRPAPQRKLWVSAPVTPKQQEAAATGSSEFRSGQKVKHEVFGTGVVLSATPQDGDLLISVAFPTPHGVKKLMQSFAKLQKA